MQELPHYLRLYTGDDFDEGVDPLAPHVLAARELLRPPARRDGPRGLEPFSRGWYEELELRRYQRQGAWLPRWLEFSRHAGESLLMLGPGLGTDAMQYQRHGTQVTVVLTPEDADERLADHLHHRGVDLPLMHVQDATALPVARGSYDLACWNALHTRADLAATLAELFRVLKPGGKLFALFPAKFDVDRWQRWLLPVRRFYRPTEPRPSTGPKRTRRELFAAMKPYSERRIVKRLLRKSELPTVWRWLPLGVMERLMGRVLAVRAFKPVAAAVKSYIAAA